MCFVIMGVFCIAQGKNARERDVLKIAKNPRLIDEFFGGSQKVFAQNVFSCLLDFGTICIRSMMIFLFAVYTHNQIRRFTVGTT